jgi:predicted ABC-type ATPase
VPEISISIVISICNNITYIYDNNNTTKSLYNATKKVCIIKKLNPNSLRNVLDDI